MNLIGKFKGKEITEMDRDDLLDFAKWASVRIQHLEKLAERHMDLDLEKEVLDK